MTEPTEIVVIEQQLTALSTGSITLEIVQNNLGELWNKAEAAGDQQALALIGTAWEHAQALAAVTEQAAGLAMTAVEVATEAMKQRDVIADELGKVANSHHSLVTAMKNLDTSHPLVEAVYEGAEETVYEWIQQSMTEGIHTDTPGMDIVENGHLGDGVTEEIADEFLGIVMGYSDTLPDDLLEELSSFIQDFTARSIDHWTRDRARRTAEYQASLKQRQAVAHD